MKFSRKTRELCHLKRKKKHYTIYICWKPIKFNSILLAQHLPCVIHICYFRMKQFFIFFTCVILYTFSEKDIKNRSINVQQVIR